MEAETTLISPQFLETIICNRGPRADGTDLGLPETIAVDYSLSTGHSCVAEVTASAFGPKADVQVNSTGSLLDIAGSVLIAYELAIEPLVNNAPNTPVSVTTKILGNAAIFGARVLGGSFSAYFQVDIPDPLGPNGGQTFRRVVNLCGTEQPGCESTDSSVNLALQVVLMLPPGTALLVQKEAGAGGLSGDLGTSVGAQAIVDPIFEITPGFLVDYNGTPTPATELYRIIYSPGITPVPAPAAGWLGLTALSLLGVRAKRLRGRRGSNDTA